MLAWISVETSGKDPRTSPILELALVVTDGSFTEVTAIGLTIKPDLSPRWQKWKESADPDFTKGHTRSGLMREIPFGMSLKTAEEALVTTLDRADGDFFIPCGSFFEVTARPFLVAQMATFAGRLEPESMDVWSVRRFFDVAGRTNLLPEVATSNRTGRAMDDIQADITEARIYAEYLKLIPEEL